MLKLITVTDYTMEELIVMSPIELRDLMDEEFPIVVSCKGGMSNGGSYAQYTTIQKKAA